MHRFNNNLLSTTAYQAPAVPVHTYTLESESFDTEKTSNVSEVVSPIRRAPPFLSFGFHSQVPKNSAPVEPIRVAPKPPRGKKRKNAFFDDIGFPDVTDEFDTLLHNMTGGDVVRRRVHPARDLDDIDPRYFVEYDDTKHGEILRKDFRPSPLLTNEQNKQLVDLIKKYWCVFDEQGIFIPIKDYECDIDTGNSPPIAVKGINYGPHETPIMRKCIAKLAEIGHISQVTDGRWLFKALLAPKPHQEHVKKIEDFVWRFCVNYIPLNAVTRAIAYPIPRCDTAVFLAFGKASYYWLMDAPMGFHQVKVAEASREKLAFQGVDAIKWTYNVMPFGVMNGPSIFTIIIQDLNSTWQQLATSFGIDIGEDNNTRPIIDDLFSFATEFTTMLTYLECQLKVARSQNLSLNLKKCFWMPARQEFVGIDVTREGNRPAQSKHELLQTWPTPTIVRDIAAFIGFAIFYSRWLPMFELRIQRLRELTKLPYTEKLGDLWDEAADAEFKDIQKALLADPCVKRFDYKLRVYLLTDFSSDGFGYCVAQPGNDTPSLEAMKREIAGGDCEFLTNAQLTLHPVAFGSRRCRDNEKNFHSHIGEAKSGDFAMNKNRHYIWGAPFTWITDCYALRFIMSYTGNNPVILRQQMRFMTWDMTIVHKPGTLMSSPDYFSRLGADLCFDPFMREYLEKVAVFKQRSPPVSGLPILPENLPGYRRKRKSAAQLDTAAANLVPAIYVDNRGGHSSSLTNVPVCFGTFEPTIDLEAVYQAAPLYNAELVAAARHISHYQWCVYSFNSGHFSSSIASIGLPFRIVLAADPYSQGRALFQKFTDCRRILNGARELYDYIRRCGDRSKLDGYMIHSHRLPDSLATRNFWQVQASIVTELRTARHLSLFVAFVHPDHDGRAVSLFTKSLERNHWLISDETISFPSLGDSVVGRMRLVIGIHSETESNASTLRIPTPPASNPAPIARYLWKSFNKIEHACSYARSSPQFHQDLHSSDSPSLFEATTPKTNESSTGPGVKVLYNLLRRDADHSITTGSSVVSTSNLCPSFTPCKSQNIFGHLFGIEFEVDSENYVRPVSSFEFVRCFNLSDDLTYSLSHPDNEFYLDAALPAFTSAHVLSSIHDRLDVIRQANVQVIEPNTIHAPAALTNVFMNASTSTRLPDKDAWVKAYDEDPETRLIKDMIQNPSLVRKENLQHVHHRLRMPLRQSLLVLENDMIIYREPLGDGSDSYCKLRLVPSKLRHILFVAFHANPLGGHLNVVRTFRNMRLRVFWPGMFAYVKDMCKKCPGCALANRTHNTSSELVYGFPIPAPMMVLHADGFDAGAIKNFEGDATYLIVACGMTAFAIMEPVRSKDAKGFAAALMKILLRFGMCHTIVIDKSSLFYGVFKEVTELLQLNTHTLSGENHDAMLVERINRYLNKGLKVMTNERSSVRVSSEAILLLLYAWNSAPCVGTEIPRSVVVTGRVFSFPIDFSASKHLDLTSTPDEVTNYAKTQAQLLSASKDILKVLIEEHRSYHRERINSLRRDPRVFNVDDIVFARRATRSDSKRGKVGKLMYAMTGPWRVVEKLPGGSYRIVHCSNKNRYDKKHASDLYPYPLELVPFEPVDGPDTRFSQIWRPISKQPYAEAGIKGFEPLQPFKLPANFADVAHDPETHWPSLQELIDDMEPFPWLPQEQEQLETSTEEEIATAFYHGPTPQPPSTAAPTIPPTSQLIASIIKSTDRLFFIRQHTSPTHAEWRLVRVIFDDSVSLRPTCLQDGKFLVEFFVLHTADLRYNCVNQRFWLQYHLPGDLVSWTDATQTHLIRPSDTSETLASRKGLLPFRQWVNLTHEDVYLHGPFDFATVNGRKTRDRIAAEHWEILLGLSTSYNNAPPNLDLPTYSVHADPGTYCAFKTPAICSNLRAAAFAFKCKAGGLYDVDKRSSVSPHPFGG